jgi:Methyltransferase domain
LVVQLDVIAAEPIDEMRETLERSLPEMRALKGAAEEVPPPDQNVDVITVAQTWHWVDVEKATPRRASGPRQLRGEKLRLPRRD